MVFSCTQIWGQDESNSFVDEMHLLEIESRMLSFYQELKDISARVGQYTSNEQLTEASQKVTTIDAKWNTYYRSRQIEIAEDDSLLQIVADYQLTKQNLLDSIAIQKHFFDAQKDFADAEVFFQAQDSAYAKLYKTAVEYSLIKALAAELDSR